MTGRPGPDEYGAFYERYVALVPDGDLLDGLRAHGAATAALLRSLDPVLGGHRYAPGKWTLTQSVQHVIDTERIFGTRALRIARGDRTPLPGFDQDPFVEAAGPDRPLADLAAEFERLRASTVDLFASLVPEAAARVGTVSGHPMSARAAGWVIAGHERHHVAIWRGRYLAA